jgi:hypothetical protein
VPGSSSSQGGDTYSTQSTPPPSCSSHRDSDPCPSSASAIAIPYPSSHITAGNTSTPVVVVNE